MRNRHEQPRASRAAPVRAGHVRRRPGLVDEDQTFRFKIRLAVEPVAALLHDVGPVLLDGVRGLFLPVRPWRWKNRESAEVDARNAALGQADAELFEALVALRLERCHDDRVPRLDPARPGVAALRFGREAARSASRRIPSDN